MNDGEGSALSSQDILTRSRGGRGPTLRLELGDPFERLGSQRRRVARDFALAEALDARHAAVECVDELAQMPNRALALQLAELLGRHARVSSGCRA